MQGELEQLISQYLDEYSPIKGMTFAQIEEFMHILNLGVACGCESILACLGNYMNHSSQLEVQGNVAARESAVYAAFAKFFECSDGPADPAHPVVYDTRFVVNMMNSVYLRDRTAHGYSLLGEELRKKDPELAKQLVRENKLQQFFIKKGEEWTLDDPPNEKKPDEPMPF